MGPTSDCGTRCLDHHVGISQSRNATAAILTGVAAAGIGVALVIVLTRPSRAEKSDFVPVLKLRLSGQRAGASATWRF